MACLAATPPQSPAVTAPPPAAGEHAPDWPALLRAAHRLSIPPNRFWALSLREWAALTGAPQTTPLARTTLDALIARFPDQTEKTP